MMSECCWSGDSWKNGKTPILTRRAAAGKVQGGPARGSKALREARGFERSPATVAPSALAWRHLAHLPDGCCALHRSPLALTRAPLPDCSGRQRGWESRVNTVLIAEHEHPHFLLREAATWGCRPAPGAGAGAGCQVCSVPLPALQTERFFHSDRAVQGALRAVPSRGPVPGGGQLPAAEGTEKGAPAESTLRSILVTDQYSQMFPRDLWLELRESPRGVFSHNTLEPSRTFGREKGCHLRSLLPGLWTGARYSCLSVSHPRVPPHPQWA